MLEAALRRPCAFSATKARTLISATFVMTLCCVCMLEYKAGKWRMRRFGDGVSGKTRHGLWPERRVGAVILSNGTAVAEHLVTKQHFKHTLLNEVSQRQGSKKTHLCWKTIRRGGNDIQIDPSWGDIPVCLCFREETSWLQMPSLGEMLDGLSDWGEDEWHLVARSDSGDRQGANSVEEPVRA